MQSSICTYRRVLSRSAPNCLASGTLALWAMPTIHSLGELAQKGASIKLQKKIYTMFIRIMTWCLCACLMQKMLHDSQDRRVNRQHGDGSGLPIMK